MTDIDTVQRWRGRTVVDQNGEKVGKFEEIYLDADSERPEWAAVTTGFFGLRQTLIPLSEAQEEGEELQVPFTKEQIKGAPNLDPDEQLSHDEERALYGHYGVPYEGGQQDEPARADAGSTGDRPATGAPGEDAGGRAAHPTADGEHRPSPTAGDRAAQPAAAGQEGDRSPTPAAQDDVAESAPPAAEPRDEEAGREEPASDASPQSDREIPLDTEVGPRERVRLKKYVVTEQVTKTVPVEREEVRVEREPFDSSQRDVDRPRTDDQADEPPRST
jgi:sporulation protein YlmC with PRC-barrel domain